MSPAFRAHIQSCIDRCERELQSGYREGVLSPMTDADRLMVEIQLELHKKALAAGMTIEQGDLFK